MSKISTCYIVNFYLGNRRRVIDLYNQDRLCYLKSHIETLESYENNLDKIIFNFNLDKEHFEIFNQALKIIPRKIQKAEVETYIRQNIGFSYGCFSHHFERYRFEYDYFIFNEDDYFLVQNNWDRYLIDKYESLPHCGYLCPIVREPNSWNNFKRFAGHCFGISSSINLNKIYNKYGSLPWSELNDYVIQEKIQIEFTNVFEEFGLKLYDIREEYRVAFSMTEEDDPDIHKHFWWNDKDLIVPAIFKYGLPYSWWESYDEEYTRKKKLFMIMKTPMNEVKNKLHTMNAIDFNHWLMKNIDKLVEVEKETIIESFNDGVSEMAVVDWWGGTPKINGNQYYDKIIE